MVKTIEYPFVCKFRVPNVFTDEISITINSGITTFIGPNGAGKTQTLKALRNYLRNNLESGKVRYLSANRIGQMEAYRSKIDQYNHSIDSYQVGDQAVKRMRHQIETATGDFFTMDERKDVYIKVAERLSVLFNRQIYLRWDSGHMKVFFEKTDTQKEYSVAAEASGLINIISILAALFDEEVKVLLVDEPEVSLHPQLQSYLLREMRTAVRKYDKTIIISTHSAEMISFNSAMDIINMIFFTEGNIPVQVEQSAPELQGKKLQDFFYRMGQVYKNGFFAQKVLLIEGVSDMILCHALADKLDLNIDVAGAQIIPVDGKGQFSVITKIFRLINKDVAILTDLDGFIDDNSVVSLFMNLPEANVLANEQGNGTMAEIINGVKTKIADMTNNYFEEIKYIIEKHPYWIIKSEEDDENKIAKRAIIGSLFSKTDDEISEWTNADEWLSIKKRLAAIFKLLQQVGCFILTKGALESYYMYSSNETYSEKPSAAADEVANLDNVEINKIKNNYNDIIVALEYMASTKSIDESYAIKKELLSELALVLGILTSDTTEKDIYAAIKQAKGSADSLFVYSIIGTNERKGIKVELKSKIINVIGFPFETYVGDNVNEIVKHHIKSLYETN